MGRGSVGGNRERICTFCFVLFLFAMVPEVIILVCGDDKSSFSPLGSVWYNSALSTLKPATRVPIPKGLAPPR